MSLDTNRDTAVNYLKDQDNGTFIIRRGDQPHVARKISVKTGGGVNHLLVVLDPATGDYRITRTMTFESLEKLLKYYSKNKLSIGELSVRLKYCLDVAKLNTMLRETEDLLCGEHWYYGKLDRKLTEKILTSASFDAGVYLVRKNQLNYYVISVITDTGN